MPNEKPIIYTPEQIKAAQKLPKTYVRQLPLRQA